MMNPVGKTAPMVPRRGTPVGPEPRMPVMGAFHKGGTVPEDGAYAMKKGEKVLTKEQKDQMSHAFGLAQAHLAHDAAPEPAHKAPKKRIKEMTIRHAKGGHVAVHRHHPPHHMPEHDEEHVIPEGKGNLAAHVMANEPEAPPMEEGESAGTQAQEAALGFK